MTLGEIAKSCLKWDMFFVLGRTDLEMMIIEQILKRYNIFYMLAQMPDNPNRRRLKGFMIPCYWIKFCDTKVIDRQKEIISTEFSIFDCNTKAIFVECMPPSLKSPFTFFPYSCDDEIFDFNGKKNKKQEKENKEKKNENEVIVPSVLIDHHHFTDKHFSIPEDSFPKAASLTRIYKLILSAFIKRPLEYVFSNNSWHLVLSDQYRRVQVAELFTIHRFDIKESIMEKDIIVTAAIDHCPKAAVDGLCPGVSPQDAKDYLLENISIIMDTSTAESNNLIIKEANKITTKNQYITIKSNRIYLLTQEPTEITLTSAILNGFSIAFKTKSDKLYISGIDIETATEIENNKKFLDFDLKETHIIKSKNTLVASLK